MVEHGSNARSQNATGPLTRAANSHEMVLDKPRSGRARLLVARNDQRQEHRIGHRMDPVQPIDGHTPEQSTQENISEQNKQVAQ